MADVFATLKVSGVEVRAGGATNAQAVRNASKIANGVIAARGLVVSGAMFGASKLAPEGSTTRSILETASATTAAGSVVAAGITALTPTAPMAAVKSVSASRVAAAGRVGLAVGGAVALAAYLSGSGKEPTTDDQKSSAAATVDKAVEVASTTATTAKAVQLAASHVARAAASGLSKVALPLTIGMAAYGAYQGYQKDGVSGIALGAADGVTGGGASMALAYLNSGAEKKAAAAPAPVKAPSPQAAQGGSASGDGGMKSYTTADGRSVQGTAAQIASWEGRKK